MGVGVCEDPRAERQSPRWEKYAHDRRRNSAHTRRTQAGPDGIEMSVGYAVSDGKRFTGSASDRATSATRATLSSSGVPGEGGHPRPERERYQSHRERRGIESVWKPPPATTRVTRPSSANRAEQSHSAAAFGPQFEECFGAPATSTAPQVHHDQEPQGHRVRHGHAAPRTRRTKQWRPARMAAIPPEHALGTRRFGGEARRGPEENAQAPTRNPLFAVRWNTSQLGDLTLQEPKRSAFHHNQRPPRRKLASA
jgi:hypothetical protein